MQIDWITVTAQAVNFLVLVWLLRRFLYRPVMDVMARREKRIRDRLDEAEAREREAAEQREAYEQHRAELDERRQALLEEARGAADERRRELLDEARAEVEEKREQWRERAEREQAEAEREIRRQTAAAVRHAAQRALEALAGADLEARIVERFLERLKDLDADDRGRLVRNAGGRLTVRSASELDAPVRSRITRAVHEHLDPELDVQYVEAPELVCGIELGVEGYRLGFSVADFLAGLDRRIGSAGDELRAAS